MTETVVWHKKPENYHHYHDNDLDQDQVDLDDEDDDDDIPPEVPKRTSSKGIGSVTLASSTSASGRSSAGSMSIRGQVKSAGNGVANTEPRQPRMCSATGRPLVEWSSESTLGASERVRRHRLHHHHHFYHQHGVHHQGHQLGLASSYPRRAGVPVPRKPVAASASAAQVSAMRQVASADEASDSEEIDVCETCSEWLSKALLCSCQVPSSASSSPSQGNELLKSQLPSQVQHQHHQQHQHHRSYPKTYQQQQPARGIVRS